MNVKIHLEQNINIFSKNRNSITYFFALGFNMTVKVTVTHLIFKILIFCSVITQDVC